jgi:hypothetical protein
MTLGDGYLKVQVEWNQTTVASMRKDIKESEHL